MNKYRMREEYVFCHQIIYFMLLFQSANMYDFI